MDKSFVNNFLIANGKYFPSNKLGRVGLLMEQSSVSEYAVNRRFYNPLVITIIFWVFLPFQLFDRFVLRDWFGGILKLIIPLICGIVLYYNQNIYYLNNNTDLLVKIVAVVIILWGIWTVVDGFTIYHRTKKANYRALLRALNINDDSYVATSVKPVKDALNNDNRSKELAEWRKNNPNASINDFYKSKK